LSVPSGVVTVNGGAAGYGTGVIAGAGGGTGGGVFKVAPQATASQRMVVAQDEPLSQAVLKEDKPTGERALLESKLHPALLEAFDCWKKSEHDCKLVKDGILEVQLWLTDDSAAVPDQLKALGFVMTQPGAKQKGIIGHVSADKLPELVKISAVRFISPRR
jgi:hypothetical protein